MAIRADDLQRFSVDEYLRLFEAEPVALERTELVNGVILNVSPESWLHAQTVRHLDELLNEIYDGRSQRNGSIRLSETSLWNPDVYVLRADADVSLPYPLAVDVELVVEVCLNSQSRDLGPKLSVYAQQQIPVYWAVQPSSPGWARVHRHPRDDRYLDLDQTELPDGYRSLDVDTLRRLIAGSD